MPPDNEWKMEPVRYMDGKSPRTPQTPRAREEKFPSPQAIRSLRLRDQFKSEKPISRSCSSLHHEGKQNIGIGSLVTPKCSWHYQRSSLEKKTWKDDELVKHMSNLPGYLQHVEKGENVQEKVFNFGVLDWERLESWKHNQKQGSGRFSMSSPSNSNTSSLFSTGASSILSSGSDSGIVPQRKQSPNLHPHMTVSSKGRPPKGMVGKNGTTRQDLKAVPKIASVAQQNLHGINLSSKTEYMETKLEKSKGKDLDQKSSLRMTNSENNVVSRPKSKSRAPDGAHTRRTDQFQEPKLPSQHSIGRESNIVLLLPRNSSKNMCSGVSQDVKIKTATDGSHTDANRRTFLDGFHVGEEVHFSKLYSEVPHSSPQLPTRKHSEMSNLKVSSDVSQLLPCSGERPTTPCMHKQVREKNLTTQPTNRMPVEPVNGLGLKVGETPAAKGSESPRPSSSLTRISRSFSSNRGSPLPQLSSSYISVQSGPAVSDTCWDGSTRDKSTANAKARSSPLRRLLDPLLKSKSCNRLNSSESLTEDSTLSCKIRRSIDGSLDSSVQPAKRVLDYSNATSSNISSVHEDGKKKDPVVQALLQVSVRNGLPWFTFAVDNNNDILAATMRKVSGSGKHDCSWIYTFYSFHKTKKKSGSWITQGNKSRSHDYVPGVVGQMKVSSSQFSKLTGTDSGDQFMAREFVLYGAEPQQTDQGAVDFHQNNELAAIVIKVPKEVRGRRDPAMGNQTNTNVVVLIPSGVHSLPVHGSPSPLIDRWRSGGSCDCGGWDVGCRLKVVSNQDQRCRKAYATQEQFDLYFQGGAQDKGPFFSMLTYNKGVHSIDFSPSMSRLQAFSICIAFLHSKNLAKVSNMFEEMNQEPVSKDTYGKVPNQVEGKTATSNSFPPRSPFGRV